MCLTFLALPKATNRRKREGLGLFHGAVEACSETLFAAPECIFFICTFSGTSFTPMREYGLSTGRPQEPIPLKLLTPNSRGRLLKMLRDGHRGLDSKLYLEDGQLDCRITSFKFLEGYEKHRNFQHLMCLTSGLPRFVEYLLEALSTQAALLSPTQKRRSPVLDQLDYTEVLSVFRQKINTKYGPAMTRGSAEVLVISRCAILGLVVDRQQSINNPSKVS